MALKRAVFFDKDGTLIPNLPNNSDTRLITLTERSTSGLRRLAALGFEAVVVTNQSGVAEGKISETAIRDVEATLRRLLSEQGVELAGFYYCPHAAAPPNRASCTCRKPRPGMLIRAAHDLQLDLTRSWMIGDILDDVEAGRRAGCRAALLANGNETLWELSAWRTPDIAAHTIDELAQLIADEESATR